MPSFRSLLRAFQPTPSDAPEEYIPERKNCTELWRRAPALIWPLHAASTAVQMPHSDSVHIYPSEAVIWAQGCTEWKTLEEHIELLHLQHGSDPGLLKAILSAVSQLTDAGLLVSDRRVREWCRKSTSAQPVPAISAIGFPTGGDQGLELAPRAVRSFAENVRTYGRSAELIVCDSSLDAALRQQYRQRLQSLSQQLRQDVRYFGLEEKQQFADELMRRGACSPRTAEFALGDPLRTGFAPGANRNMLLLHQAGSMFCSVDHDVLCRTVDSPEEAPRRLSLFSECDPFARWTFSEAAEPERKIQWKTPDFLALHEEMLGRGIHEVVQSEAPEQPIDFQNARDAILQRLALGDVCIRATFCGHFGEPGVPSAVYYLAYRGENRRRLTRSEAHYRASLASRSLLALSPAPAIGDASLSPGVAFGMDHRELLPPFFPVLHAEDFSWSALAWQCCPGTIFGLIPQAIAHAPLPGNAFLAISDLPQMPPFVIWEWAHLLRFWTMTWSPAATMNSEARLRTFARALGEIAALPAPDFAAELRRAALSTASHQIAFYDSQLHATDEDLPEYWAADVNAYLHHLERSLTHDGFEVPLDLQQRTSSLTEARALAQQLVKRYADLLASWPEMVSAAREIRHGTDRTR